MDYFLIFLAYSLVLLGLVIRQFLFDKMEKNELMKDLVEKYFRTKREQNRKKWRKENKNKKERKRKRDRNRFNSSSQTRVHRHETRLFRNVVHVFFDQTLHSPEQVVAASPALKFHYSIPHLTSFFSPLLSFGLMKERQGRQLLIRLRRP